MTSAADVAAAIRRLRTADYADLKLTLVRLIEAHLEAHGPVEVDGEVWSLDRGIVTRTPAEVKP